jgi:integrase
MSVRKRSWTTDKGEARTAWVVDYTDQGGKRRLKTFSKKRDADSWSAKAMTEIGKGIHTSGSDTVAKAGEDWIASREAAGLERSTLVDYRGLLDLHIAPLLGSVKLADLTLPRVRKFEDELREGRSPAMVKKTLVCLSSILNDALDRGSVAQNVMHRRRSRNGNAEARRKRRLEVGVDIPTVAEVRALIPHLKGGRERPLILTAIFTGLRASELRGLTWKDVDLERNEIHVRQRVDRFRSTGPLKSTAGRRSVPLLPMVVNALREWRLACPRSSDLVFPGRGGPLVLTSIMRYHWWPVQLRAGLVSADTGDDGKPQPKYSGFHALRHFYASWCINRRADGGLELPIKVVQGRLGHAWIQMTADRYGHLFPRGDDAAELAAAERAFLTA